MFSYLFKYPETTWRGAEWFFASDWPSSMLIVSVVIAAVCIAWSLMSQPLTSLRKCIVWALQFSLVSLLLVLMWQPTLRSKVVEPGDNGLALMLDTSRSMAYSDGSESRFDTVIDAFEKTQLLSEMSTEFNLELIAVADQNTVLETPDSTAGNSFESTFDALGPPSGSSSKLGQGLQEVVESAAERVLAGVVIITDGADTSRLQPAWWQQLAASQVPVYAIGVGEEILTGDLSIASVDIAESATVDSPVNAKVSIRYDVAGPARLRIFDGNDLLYAKTVELPEGSNEFGHVAEIVSGEEGLRDLKFELESKANEKNLVNNTQRRILSVKAVKRRILYIEGEPRWEFKFIRRALHNSPEIELVTLLHTSPNKFYRQGVASESELADGFPTDRESLFAYDAVMIGSYEAAMLTDQQQQNLRDFVRVRGGSLMMLAGPNGLSDGGWARSVVAQALPVSMPDYKGGYLRKRAQATITALGEETQWLKLGTAASDNVERWNELPMLADLQDSGAPKAGASVLLEAVREGERLPLLTWQRYGRGKSYVLASSGTWRWQMGLSSEDQRHELFWQGLLGDLVSGVLPRLSVSTEQPVYLDDSIVDIVIDARDALFQSDNSASVSAVLQGPDSEEELPVKADPDLPGRFYTQVDAGKVGEYKVKVSWTEAGETLEQDSWFLRQDNLAEDFALTLDRPFLQRIATETGGQYLPLARLSELPDLIRQSESRLVRNELLPVWNLPAVFLLLLFLKLMEWALRWRWNHL